MQLCISEQTASVAPCSCNRLVVYNRDGECLLRGTNWVFKSKRLIFSAKAPSGPGPPHCRGFTITTQTHHTQYGSSGRVISQTQGPDNTNNSHKRQTSTHPAGFEPVIPTSERPQTHALDRAATGIGCQRVDRRKMWCLEGSSQSRKGIVVTPGFVLLRKQHCF